MSEPERVDCHRAVAELYPYLDGELTPHLERAIRAHLATCAHCFGLFNFERVYLDFLRARARARSAPEPLRRRILESLLVDPGSDRP